MLCTRILNDLEKHNRSENVAKINVILLIIVVKNINLVQRYNYWAVC